MHNYKYLALLIVLIFTSEVFATSGACSSHNGVNCSAGADINGKVQCNDGWINSSVYFSDTEECKVICMPPVANGCTNESDYGAIQVKLSGIGSYLGNSASGLGASQTCRNQITEYQNAYQEYLNCKNNSANNSYSSQNYSYSGTLNEKMQQYCVGKYGSQSIYNSTKISCECPSGYGMKNGQCILLDTVCKNDFGDKSSYDKTIDACRCESGYVNPDNTKCVLGDTYCSKKFGSDNWYDSSIKKCVACIQNGVKGARQGNQCIYPNVSTNNSTSTLVTTKFKFKTNLKLGVRNEEVKVLQNLLLKHNFLKGTATGYFGPATQTALKKYQKNNKLLQTGVVDNATLNILNI